MGRPARPPLRTHDGRVAVALRLVLLWLAAPAVVGWVRLLLTPRLLLSPSCQRRRSPEGDGEPLRRQPGDGDGCDNHSLHPVSLQCTADSTRVRRRRRVCHTNTQPVSLSLKAPSKPPDTTAPYVTTSTGPQASSGHAARGVTRRPRRGDGACGSPVRGAGLRARRRRLVRAARRQGCGRVRRPAPAAAQPCPPCR